MSQYTGHALVRRIVFVAKKAAEKKDEQLELDALKVCFEEAKKSENTALYKEATSLIGGRLGQEYDPDAAWMEQVDRRTAQKQDKLESELNGYKANLIKESIRMGHTFLGEFFYDKGDLQSALKCYIRTRDYCTTSNHVVTMCLNVIKVSLELENYLHVLNYVQKGEQSPSVAGDPKVADKLKCAAGLANLANKKYKIAARSFLQVSAELDDNYSDVIAPQDVATYGAICALVILGASLVLGYGWNLSVTVSLALIAVIVFAALFGTFVPLTLDQFKIDPALATGPFITTANDIIGLIIYFGIGVLMAA